MNNYSSTTSTSTSVAEAIASAHRMAMFLVSLQAAQRLSTPDTDAGVVVWNSTTGTFTVINVPPTGADDKSDPLPASKLAIDAMPRWVVAGGGCDVEDCVICLEECRVGSEIREMPCKHWFHSRCIERWLRVHGSCPVCRFLMPAEDEEGDGGGEDGRRQRRRTMAIDFIVVGSGSDSDDDGGTEGLVGDGSDNSGSDRGGSENSGSGDDGLENLESDGDSEVDSSSTLGD